MADDNGQVKDAVLWEQNRQILALLTEIRDDVRSLNGRQRTTEISLRAAEISLGACQKGSAERWVAHDKQHDQERRSSNVVVGVATTIGTAIAAIAGIFVQKP